MQLAEFQAATPSTSQLHLRPHTVCTCQLNFAVSIWPTGQCGLWGPVCQPANCSPLRRHLVSGGWTPTPALGCLRMRCLLAWSSRMSCDGRYSRMEPAKLVTGFPCNKHLSTIPPSTSINHYHPPINLHQPPSITINCEKLLPSNVVLRITSSIIERSTVNARLTSGN